MYRRSITCIAILSLLSIMGCSDSEPQEPGQLRVEWRIGGKSCDQVGVDRVEIMAINRDTLAAEGVITETCSTYGAILDQLPSGYYLVKLNGYDTTGKVIYEGSYPNANTSVEEMKDQWLFVPPSRTMQVPSKINLSGKPGEVYLSWYFRNGRLCAANGVYQANVYAYDSMSNPVVEASFPCDPLTGGYGMTPVESDTAENPSVRPNGSVLVAGFPAGTVDLIVEGVSSDGQLKFLGKAKFSITHGELRDLEVPLEDCSVVLCNY